VSGIFGKPILELIFGGARCVAAAWGALLF